MKKKTIIFYAPLGSTLKGFNYGGGETGCRRTLEILSKNLCNRIIVLEKPKKSNNTIYAIIKLIINQISILFRFTFIVLCNRNCTLHLVGFYSNQLFFEWSLISLANFFGVNTIYEIRNGNMIDTYERGCYFYRKFLLSTIKKSDKILCQGEKYISFINNNLNKEATYYPNYIMDKYLTIKLNDERSKTDIIKLVYIGRVVEEKNIELIIDIAHEIKLNSLNFCLTIIGGYKIDYYSKIIKKCKLFGLKIGQEVFFLGRLDPDSIFDILKGQHFFLFPSNEKKEGHSNSLTECMSCGVVPIVSNVGFNEAVVHNPFLVVDDFEASSYALKVIEIWNNNKWKTLSNQMHKIVVDNYTESIVTNNLLDIYMSLK